MAILTIFYYHIVVTLAHLVPNEDVQVVRRKSTGTRREVHKSPYKMKPLPHDLHFDEVTFEVAGEEEGYSSCRWTPGGS